MALGTPRIGQEVQMSDNVAYHSAHRQENKTDDIHFPCASSVCYQVLVFVFPRDQRLNRIAFDTRSRYRRCRLGKHDLSVLTRRLI